jgi:DNA-binding MarR family transcriptional regulator
MTMDQMVEPRRSDEIDIGQLGTSLGFLLRMAQLRTFVLFHERLAGQGLKPGEFSVLMIIGRNPGIRQGLLAQRLMIKRAHMTKLVRSFEDRGLVARRIPEHDRRAVELTLTDAGQAFVAERAAPLAAYERELPGALSESEQRELIRLLQRYAGVAP